MAHELSITTEGIVEMMYVGETPWHNLGTPLPQLATANEALEAAHLDWNVITEPVLSSQGIRLKDRNLTIREDTGIPLGVVSERYQVLNNRDAFRFMDSITMDPHGPKYETAGALYGGRKVWMLARLDGFREVIPDDAVGQYLLLWTAHDGSTAVNVALTPIRVVCKNTLSMAIGSVGRSAKIRHTKNVFSHLENVQDALGFLRQSFDETFELYQKMAQVEPTKEEIESVLEQLIPDTKREGRAKNQRARVLELAVAGTGNSNGHEGTWWNIYNGVTELVDHHNGGTSKRADKDDYRLDSMWFGIGKETKETALQLIEGYLN